MKTADFETTTNTKDCRVWSWGISDIETLNYESGINIDSFMERVFNSKPDTYYFHNLKFDGQFIISWLFKNGYKYSDKTFKKKDKEFSTIISDKGQWYQIEVCKYSSSKGRNAHYRFTDSLKLLPFSVEKIAKDFKLPILKGKIDYEKERPVGYIPDENEIKYQRNDCEIMARALKIFFELGDSSKLTIGSNALSFYKKQVGQKVFDRRFPVPKYDRDIRQCYKGGWAYLNPKFANKIVRNGIVLDVNSLYPWVMHDEMLPFGEPIFFNGEYNHDEMYPLYVQMFTCNFELRENYLPTIQLKGNLSFVPTEYVTSSNGEDITLCLTSVDLKLFFEHYHVYNVTYHSGWKFRQSNTMFRNYIDYWMDVKINAEKTGNEALRTIAKLYLNNLYGKFSKNPLIASKYPVWDNGIVKYKTTEYEETQPIYIPVGAFITAGARNKTIRAAQKVYDRFVYADTDSLHLEGLEIPEGIEVDKYKLGAWKNEGVFKRAKFLRAKAYVEDLWYKEVDGNLKACDLTDYLAGLHKQTKLKVTCAGLPKSAIDDVTFNNFKIGFVTDKSLKQKIVEGGAVLKKSEFRIRA